MNAVKALAPILVACVILGCATPRQTCVVPQQSVLGTWYMSGDVTKPCHVWTSPQGLQVQNEFSLTSRLAYDPAGFVIALDWLDGMRGDVRDGAILWRNGSWWSRVPAK
jgi:hypothetical protein